MLRKIIHFYIANDNEDALVHIVEMSRLPVEHNDPPPHSLIKPAHFWLCMAFNQYTAPNIPSTEPAVKTTTSTFTCLHRKSYSYFAPDDDNFYYKVIHACFKLPKNSDQLFKFMLSLDGCIHDIKYNNALYDTAVEFFYADVTGVDLRFAPITHHAFSIPAADASSPIEYFSVFLASGLLPTAHYIHLKLLNSSLMHYMTSRYS